MNNKVNYTLIGILVLIGFGMIVVFSYWLLQPTNERVMKNYYIYFDESVLGLNLEAPVKYRGIDVGKVSKINISPKNTEQVQVTVSILKTTPIKTTTRAKLTSQGITGLSYINLTMGKNGTELLKEDGDEKYPIIKTTPSFFEQFENSFGDVSANLSKTLVGTQELFNKENQEQIKLILKRSAKLMDKLDRMFDDNTINNFQKTFENIEVASAKINKLIPKVEKLVDNSVEWEDKLAVNFNSIMGSYKGIEKSMQVFKDSITRGDYNINSMTKEILPNINNTLVDMQRLIIDLELLVEQYEKSPSDIFYKKQEIHKGPGE